MPAWDREEVTEVGCLGDRGIDGEVILGIWDTADGGLFVPLPGTNIFVRQQRLFGGGTEPLEGAGKTRKAGEDIGKVGSG